jgi:3-isopropylmalate/(R)-2-methylmalate dehydratase large subunit
MAGTLLDRIWDAHLVTRLDDGRDLIYVDLHLVHEVTSAQAFAGLQARGRTVRRPDRTFATMDHNVPTSARHLPIADVMARAQVDTLRDNCRHAGIRLFDLDSPHQGIVHVIGPELGLTQPGMTVVCGDSHTSTHGALGALAFGIGTSEVEHVLATQCLALTRPRTMRVVFNGSAAPGVSAKDAALAMVRHLGMAGGTGYALELDGAYVRRLSMEQRMTLCNMAIEAGARSALVAPDATTLAYLRGRAHAPRRAHWMASALGWNRLRSDPGAVFDAEITLDAGRFAPLVTWGTRPDMAVSVTGRVPLPESLPAEADRQAARRALAYMNLEPGTPITSITVDRVFIGSCTNGRLSDLREAAAVVAGHQVASGVRAMVVPGSVQVKQAAEREGLADTFLAAGFEWREPGCSMCLGMNDDVLGPGERCASTSNRNFEGRQGRGGRTHLVSPAMAAAAAVAGRFVDVRQWDYRRPAELRRA